MRLVLLIVAGLALAGFVVVAVVLPEMAGNEAKEAASALLSGSEPARQAVAAAARKSGSLSGSGAEVKLAARNDPRFGEMKWVVERNGTIRGWNEKNAIEIALQPRLEADRVSWTCRGHPIGAMPPECGGAR